MSATQDWTALTSDGPARYQRLLVPAVFDPFAQRLVAHARVRQGMRVLDVACGTGAVSRVAARAVGPKGSVVAVDISAPMLAIAAACAPESGAAPIDYRQGPAEDPPVQKHAFDLVFCQQGLQFFVDRAAALAAMRRALVVGGRLAIATWTDLPAAISFAALADALERHLGAGAGAQMRQPWSLSDADELRHLAARSGFEQIQVSTHTGTARFPRHDFARERVLATPLANQFRDATAQAQAAVVADVTDAVSVCDGDDVELCHPLTANFLTAVAPDPVARARRVGIGARPANREPTPGRSSMTAVRAMSTAKAAARAAWAMGDYHAFAKATIWEMGPVLVQACGISAGQRVLDVAAGTGNTAIPAADTGATVVASDLTPQNFAAGQAEAAARGVDLTWVQADAEALPFADGEFDVVTSSFGAIFAPDHQAVAHEMLRVLRPGGTIGMLNFTPEGLIGEFFGVFEPYAPPPEQGALSPALWGSEDHVRELFGDRLEVLEMSRGRYVERAASPRAYRELFTRTFGPVVALYESLADQPARLAALDQDFLEFATHANSGPAGGGAEYCYEYLLVIGRKGKARSAR